MSKLLTEEMVRAIVRKRVLRNVVGPSQVTKLLKEDDHWYDDFDKSQKVKVTKKEEETLKDSVDDAVVEGHLSKADASRLKHNLEKLLSREFNQKSNLIMGFSKLIDPKNGVKSFVDQLIEDMTFPVSAPSCWNFITSFAGFVMNDKSENMVLTRMVMALYAEENETFGEFLLGGFLESIPELIAGYFSGGTTFLLTKGAREGAEQVSKKALKDQAKRIAKKKAAMKAAADRASDRLPQAVKEVENAILANSPDTLKKAGIPDDQVDELFALSKSKQKRKTDDYKRLLNQTAKDFAASKMIKSGGLDLTFRGMIFKAGDASVDLKRNIRSTFFRSQRETNQNLARQEFVDSVYDLAVNEAQSGTDKVKKAIKKGRVQRALKKDINKMYDNLMRQTDPSYVESVRSLSSFSSRFQRRLRFSDNKIKTVVSTIFGRTDNLSNEVLERITRSATVRAKELDSVIASIPTRRKLKIAGFSDDFANKIFRREIDETDRLFKIDITDVLEVDFSGIKKINFDKISPGATKFDDLTPGQQRFLKALNGEKPFTSDGQFTEPLTTLKNRSTKLKEAINSRDVELDKAADKYLNGLFKDAEEIGLSKDQVLLDMISQSPGEKIKGRLGIGGPDLTPPLKPAQGASRAEITAYRKKLAAYKAKRLAQGEVLVGPKMDLALGIIKGYLTGRSVRPAESIFGKGLGVGLTTPRTLGLVSAEERFAADSRFEDVKFEEDQKAFNDLIDKEYAKLAREGGTFSDDDAFELELKADEFVANREEEAELSGEEDKIEERGFFDTALGYLATGLDYYEDAIKTIYKLGREMTRLTDYFYDQENEIGRDVERTVWYHGGDTALQRFAGATVIGKVFVDDYLKVGSEEYHYKMFSNWTDRFRVITDAILAGDYSNNQIAAEEFAKVGGHCPTKCQMDIKNAIYRKSKFLKNRIDFPALIKAANAITMSTTGIRTAVQESKGNEKILISEEKLKKLIRSKILKKKKLLKEENENASVEDIEKIQLLAAQKLWDDYGNNITIGSHNDIGEQLVPNNPPGLQYTYKGSRLQKNTQLIYMPITYEGESSIKFNIDNAIVVDCGQDGKFNDAIKGESEWKRIVWAYGILNDFNGPAQDLSAPSALRKGKKIPDDYKKGRLENLFKTNLTTIRKKRFGYLDASSEQLIDIRSKFKNTKEHNSYLLLLVIGNGQPFSSGNVIQKLATDQSALLQGKGKQYGHSIATRPFNNTSFKSGGKSVYSDGLEPTGENAAPNKKKHAPLMHFVYTLGVKNAGGAGNSTPTELTDDLKRFTESLISLGEGKLIAVKKEEKEKLDKETEAREKIIAKKTPPKEKEEEEESESKEKKLTTPKQKRDDFYKRLGTAQASQFGHKNDPMGNVYLLSMYVAIYMNEHASGSAGSFDAWKKGWTSVQGDGSVWNYKLSDDGSHPKMLKIIASKAIENSHGPFQDEQFKEKIKNWMNTHAKGSDLSWGRPTSTSGNEPDADTFSKALYHYSGKQFKGYDNPGVLGQLNFMIDILNNYSPDDGAVFQGKKKRDQVKESKLIKKSLFRRKIRELLLKEYKAQKLSLGGLGSGGGYSGTDDENQETIEDGIIEGEKFTVKGVVFQSVPSKLGAKNAKDLYDKINGAGDKQPGHKKVKNPEMQRQGLELIKNYIYEPVRPGEGDKYIKRTGTPSESFWSSWFFGAVYGKDPDYHKVWSNRGVGYPARKALKQRDKVFENPDRYKGKTLYLTFHVKEAPVFPGDAIFHWRAEMKGSSFFDIRTGGPAHMKVMGSDGAFYGGNEGHSLGKPGTMKDQTVGSTVGKSSFSLTGDKRLVYPNKGDYMAVFKKVIVLGRSGDEIPDPDKEAKKDTEKEDKGKEGITEAYIRRIIKQKLLSEYRGQTLRGQSYGIGSGRTTLGRGASEESEDSEDTEKNFKVTLPSDAKFIHPLPMYKEKDYSKSKVEKNELEKKEKEEEEDKKTKDDKKDDAYQPGYKFNIKDTVPVLAYAKGVVLTSGYNANSGNNLYIKHDRVELSGGETDGKLITGYAQLQKTFVSKGQEVNAGDLIGLTGASGNAKYPMLRFILRNSGVDEFSVDNDFYDQFLNKASVASVKYVETEKKKEKTKKDSSTSDKSKPTEKKDELGELLTQLKELEAKKEKLVELQSSEPDEATEDLINTLDDQIKTTQAKIKEHYTKNLKDFGASVRSKLQKLMKGFSKNEGKINEYKSAKMTGGTEGGGTDSSGGSVDFNVKDPVKILGGSYPENNVRAVEAAMDKYKITNKYLRIAILSVLAKESGMKPKSEKTYAKTSNARIKEIWPWLGRKYSDDELDKLKKSTSPSDGHKRKGLGLFDLVYANKYGNGNQASGDGSRYRGRGFNQVTFKSTYAKYGLANDPDSLNKIDVAAEVAIKFLLKRLKSHNPNYNNVSSQVEANKLAAEANCKSAKSKKNCARAIASTTARNKDFSYS